MRETLSYRRTITSGTCLILFFAGLLAGVLFVQTLDDSSGYAGIFSEYFLSQYASLRIDHKRLLWYVGRYRISQYAFLICSMILPAAPVILGGILFLLGMTWGTLISVSTIRLGLKGVLICATGILPQIFFYVPAFGWVLLWFWKQGSSRKKYLLFSLAGFFFLFFGIITEAYLNPLILQQILRKI